MSDQTLIDPDALPGRDLKLDDVSGAADGIAAKAAAIRDGGAAIESAWSGLPAVYRSTGSEAVYTAMQPVSNASTSFGDSLDQVVGALRSYVETVAPIKAQLDTLYSDAVAFRAKAQAFKGDVVTTHNWALGPAAGLGLSGIQVDNWYEDPTLNDRNTALIDKGFLLSEQLREAADTCAQKIRAAAGLTKQEVVKAATEAPDHLVTE